MHGIDGGLRGLFCALLFLTATGVIAAGPLTTDVRPVAVRARAMAPEMVEVRLTSSAQGLLEGPLEFTMIAGKAPPFRYRTHDLALAAGAHTFRFLLPEGSPGEYGADRSARVRFLGKAGAIDLGEFPIETRLNADRVLTIAVSKPPAAGAQREFALWRRLRLERLQNPDEPESRGDFATAPVFIDGEDFPAAPLALCAYDIVLLEHDGFALLREKQLAALARWVLAGGSLWVRPGETIEGAPGKFLADLLAADGRAPAFDLNAAGLPTLPGEDGLLLARPGLGRLVIASLTPENEEDRLTPARKRAVAFLWKFRDAQMERVLKNRPFYPPPTDTAARARTMNELRGLLMPESVRLVPLGWVVAILLGFILVVGPLDWFVLGRLKMRRLTWVLFPCVSAAFTFFTVWLAGKYMGAGSHRSALTITDLGLDGRVVRETRFELIFPARNEEFATEIQNALCEPVSSANLEGTDLGGSAGTTIYEGQFPARYRLRQQLRQWSPQLNRMTSIESREDDSGIAWEQIREMFPTGYGPAKVEPPLNFEPAIYIFREGSWSMRWVGRLGPTFDKDFVTHCCIAAPGGLMSLAAQLSPNGAANFDDLALAEAGDKSISFLAVVRREGAGVHLFRKIFNP